MKYRSEIDGLRSFAVLPVILFHGGLTLFSGGFVGVDVFFVISGYLITTIIITQLNEGRFSLLDFYARRARRILPALFLVVACCLPFAWMWMLPTQFKDFAQSIAAVSLFSSNFLFWLESGYFAPAAELKPLLHTWSLAVEEQYYILFPLLLMAFWRRMNRALLIGLALIFVLSLGASEWLWRTAPSANFYLLPTRAWELLAGAFCAIWMVRGAPAGNNALGALGLALVVVPIFVYDSSTPFPSLYALAPVAGACLIILFARAGTLVAQFLSLKPLVGIGLISYSAYLWHQPLFAFARIKGGHAPGLTLMMGLAVLSLILAYFSWRFVETPFRRGKLPAGGAVLRAGICSFGVLCLGAGLSVTGWHQSYFIKSLDPQNLPLLAQINQMRAMDHFATEDQGDCRFYINDYGVEQAQRFEDCFEQHGPALVVFGDSHSLDVYKGLVGAMDASFLIGLAQNACRPHIAGSDCTTSNLPRFFADQKDRVGRAFYVQAGFGLLMDADGSKKGRSLFLSSGPIDARLDRPAIDRALTVLAPWAEMVPMTWIGPRFEPHIGQEYMLGLACDEAANVLELRPSQVEIFDRLDAYLAELVPDTGLTYFSEIKAIDFDVKTETYDCDQLYWSDGDHWSPAGEAFFGPRLAAALEN